MLIKIWKQRTLQANQFEPISFGYGLEEEVNNDARAQKEIIEGIVDEWIEKETKKWEKYKKKGSGNAVAPIKERELKDDQGNVIPF